MNNLLANKDLVLLVADKDMEFAIRGILNRHLALGIRAISADVFIHPERDPGCYLSAHDFLRSMAGKYQKSLVLFDRDGCGAEEKTREELEKEVEKKLAAAGWNGRSRVVVLDPELEIWVWSDSPHVANILGWKSTNPLMQKWLIEKKYLHEGDAKPHAPKEAMQAVLRLARLPRSASRYQQLAEKVSLERCSDAAFMKLKATLQGWFAQ